MRVQVAVQAADSVVAAVVAEEGQLEQAGEQELLQKDDCALRMPSVKPDEAAEAGQDQGQGQDQSSQVEKLQTLVSVIFWDLSDPEGCCD